MISLSSIALLLINEFLFEYVQQFVGRGHVATEAAIVLNRHLAFNAGQMVEDVKLAVECKMPVEHYGRFGGNVPTPDELLNVLKEKLINK